MASAGSFFCWPRMRAMAEESPGQAPNSPLHTGVALSLHPNPQHPVRSLRAPGCKPPCVSEHTVMPSEAWSTQTWQQERASCWPGRPQPAGQAVPIRAPYLCLFPEVRGDTWQVDHNNEEGLTLDGGASWMRGLGRTQNGQKGSRKRRQPKQRPSGTRHPVGSDEGEDGKFPRVLEGKASTLG